ncbi:MAG: hypothetical protein U5M51_13750 [Emticicia sp.]|nr:hypothetical protein [Emticicia sp.]
MGSLSAPPMVMQWHGVEHYSTKDKIRNLALNIGRYSSEFLNLDGIRGTDWGRELNIKFRYLPNKFFNNFNLEGDRFTVVSYFSFEHPLELYKERPYWGIIAFGIIIPVVLVLLWKFLFKRSSIPPTEKSLMVLSVAAVLHFLSLSYSAPYDPIKGRYFLNMAVWCMPLLTMFFVEIKSKIFSVYAIITTIIISLSAICTTLTVRLHPVFEPKNIFNTNRLEQLTIGRPDIYEAYKKFDELVPKDAIVALGTQQEHEDFEYPLWGKDFKRKLIPIHPFRSAVKPIPAEAQYLFYSKGVIPFQEGDIRLGGGNKIDDSVVEESEFYLRILKVKNDK